MKQFGCIVLVLCLLSGFALAEREPMILWNVDMNSSFWKDHRDIQYERFLLNSSDVRLAEFQSSKVDVALLRLNYNDLQPFIDADALADLSESPGIRDGF